MVAFYAYPSHPQEIGQTIEAFVEQNNLGTPKTEFRSWKANEISGYCLVDPIREEIENADFVAADITVPNFNVIYEIGFAIGKRKRVILTRHNSLVGDDATIREIGIFDTLGYENYSSVNDLKKIFSQQISTKPLEGISQHNSKAPIYVLLPREQTESETRMVSRLKKVARLNYRSYDPSENPRLSARTAIKGVSESFGVLIPLVPETRKRAAIHNYRAAFLAGLAHSLDRDTLILQSGTEPIPLDYRDYVVSYGAPHDVDRHIATFAPRIAELLQQGTQAEFDETTNPLQAFFLGESAAENEFRDLRDYYLQVAQFSRVVNEPVQVVAGRKGSGKSALFFQLRDKVRRHRKNIVVDLNPDGFQLRKFKTLVVNNLEQGTKEHTITAFWEYLLLLELCYKVLEKDHQRHLFDHTLTENYQLLKKLYGNDEILLEGDFAERLLLITSVIEEKLSAKVDIENSDNVLTREEITEVLYAHDIQRLRDVLEEYLGSKGDIWILFDNLDKGWAADGVTEEDLLLLRCLLECLRKMQNRFKKIETNMRGVVFVRNDVYELLVGTTSDRGKISRVTMEWSDPDLLRELVRKRLTAKLSSDIADFDEVWRQFCISHLEDGTESSQFIIDRTLLRPRCLLDFLTHAKSHALNLGHTRIEEEDIIWAEDIYSTDLIHSIELEISDVFSNGEGCLYSFIESQRFMESADLYKNLEKVSQSEEEIEQLKELLIWYGFLGLYRRSGEETYIYNVNYEMRKMKALVANRDSGDTIYCVNLAFCKGLDINI